MIRFITKRKKLRDESIRIFQEEVAGKDYRSADGSLDMDALWTDYMDWRSVASQGSVTQYNRHRRQAPWWVS